MCLWSVITEGESEPCVYGVRSLRVRVSRVFMESDH